jgi:hypothetical protein
VLRREETLIQELINHYVNGIVKWQLLT